MTSRADTLLRKAGQLEEQRKQAEADLRRRRDAAVVRAADAMKADGVKSPEAVERFVAATGLSPARYWQILKVTRARLSGPH